MNNQIDKVLAERGARYGDFADHARIAQQLQDVMRNAGGAELCWLKLSDVQKQALTVIADKIARILSGDPNYDDNWIDIQGYAKLAQDRLPKKPTPWAGPALPKVAPVWPPHPAREAAAVADVDLAVRGVLPRPVLQNPAERAAAPPQQERYEPYGIIPPAEAPWYAGRLGGGANDPNNLGLEANRAEVAPARLQGRDPDF